MTAASPEKADVTASLMALEAPVMPDLRASHPEENLSKMGDTKFHAALIAVLMPSQAGEIALFHSHRAPWPSRFIARFQLSNRSEATSQARPITSLMPFQAGVIALFHNHVAAAPMTVNAALRPGNTVVDNHPHTAPMTFLMAAQVT
ncbi:Uncharacterised protein [Mycobacteroides abscessus subsp. abscessus]|nr:Uncharacterised protein [Mycobacteroides abscessus subsp. abscessus]